ncbi:MAG: hypothetical protein ACLGIR_08380 [Actinomycetes bacterium]
MAPYPDLRGHPLRPLVREEVDDWIRVPGGRLATVGDCVPRELADVAVVLPPWHTVVGEEPTPVRWDDAASMLGLEDRAALVAAQSGATLMPGYERVGDRYLWVWDRVSPPGDGSLVFWSGEPLRSVLTAHTTTPDELVIGRFVPSADGLHQVPGIVTESDHAWLTGPLSGAWHPLPRELPHRAGAGVSFPRDHAWYLHVLEDMNLPFTLVAGSSDLITALTEHPDLEVVRCRREAILNDPLH